MPLANLSIQIVPLGTEHPYPIIDAAIAAIGASGTKYEVQPFSTILEGEPEELMRVAGLAREAALAAGAKELLVNLQLHLKSGENVRWEDKTAKFRP